MGTVTLEAALIGCPIVGVYRMSSSTYLIARRLYKGKYVALPNIIAGRGSCRNSFKTRHRPNGSPPR